MCELCGNQKHISPTSMRRRIWEMKNNSQCSIVGTCLTISDLRTLARKLKIQIVPGYSPDYQLHGFFAKEAENQSKPAKMLNKLLDKRHASSIRKARSMYSNNALKDYWIEALNAGEIPGPYWAILSHPKVTKDLSDRLFADVHMLSHMVGASNRADIRRLRAIEEQTEKIEHRLNRQRALHTEKLAKRDLIIDKLQSKIHNIESAVTAALPTEKIERCVCETVPNLHSKISGLTKELKVKNSTINAANDRIRDLEVLLDSLQAENTNLEAALTQRENNRDDADLFDLDGKSLLYVGGRQQTVHRLRALVAHWNGELLHHDGGIESSIDQLTSILNKADAVVFPTDCVSHSAAKTVKKLCNQRMKPFIPLRTSGIASFITILKERKLSRYAE